jgi:hypothetical protein
MNTYNNRETVINRVKKELIGPGSDIFHCQDTTNYTDEVIEGKPLMRYFSGILFPKQKLNNGVVDVTEDDDEADETNPDNVSDEDKELGDKIVDPEQVNSNNHEEKGEIQYTANTFFPSQYGISFATSTECKDLNIEISFGCYKKAKEQEIALHYDGDSIDLLSQYGLSPYVIYDKDNKLLKLPKEPTREEKRLRLANQLQMRPDHGNSGLYKAISKLFFKDKYKRFDNKITAQVSIQDILSEPDCHKKILLSSISGVDTTKWWKSKIGKVEFKLSDNLLLHIKAYPIKDKLIFKAIIENTLSFPKDKFSLAKEALNQICLFQTEIKVESNYLVPFSEYKDVLYKSSEDQMFDYLYREKLAYGIGHNVACTWENCEDDNKKPNWIASTFIPQYNVKSQSTEIDKIPSETLLIKNISSFNNDKNDIIDKLTILCGAYETWIDKELDLGQGREFASHNSLKCKKIDERIREGIELLRTNKNAMRAFQLANTAIYLQMFNNEKYFNSKKDGYEAWEQSEFNPMSYIDYQVTEYPNEDSIPSWRPFQLAFILQCLPSFINAKSPDRDLVDLLYFPTGGGKTEAYLAVSAFLIFWRRLQYPNEYGGVNIIIRYTLRLLSAQQFERASKLILACEFIRQNQLDLGDKKVTIGFWVGDSTIPNDIIKAQKQLNNTNDRLNKGLPAINPFQVSNCQWCNTKMVGRLSAGQPQSFGHRINSKKELFTFCPNPKCNFSQEKEGLPIVLVDEDIYKNPPTMLFATVDKFAQLAWKEEATALFNHGHDRKPELIIQDELHLLSGPLGSLVGLFENVLLSLCSNDKQSPKIIASTATIKNVDKQIEGLYGRKAQIFPQSITSADDTFFSKIQESSKRRYIGILPTGKTFTMANLRLNSALLFARLDIWRNSENKSDADKFWTILSYFKSLKHIGRFANKITAELTPEIKQLQVRYLMNQAPYNLNYNKLPYRNLELTSRIPNEQIKKNLDRLSISFNGDLGKHHAFDLVLATNMISVGLDVGRLNVMLMNGMPPNTAEYIQASSRVARQDQGVVFTLFDPNNTRDLSYFEDFIPFHKTFYKQVEPLSVTPFAENALDKMLFTLMVTYFRHKMGFYKNKDAAKLKTIKAEFVSNINNLLNNHLFIDNEDKNVLAQKIFSLVQDWEFKIDATLTDCLYYYGGRSETEKKKNLLIPIQDKQSEHDIRVAMQSMRAVEPSAIINIKKY